MPDGKWGNIVTKHVSLAIRITNTFTLNNLPWIDFEVTSNNEHWILKVLWISSLESSDQSNGKTALMKALLNVSSGENEMVDFLLNIADDMGDIQMLINSSYTSDFYKGRISRYE